MGWEYYIINNFCSDNFFSRYINLKHLWVVILENPLVVELVPSHSRSLCKKWHVRWECGNNMRPLSWKRDTNGRDPKRFWQILYLLCRNKSNEHTDFKLTICLFVKGITNSSDWQFLHGFGYFYKQLHIFLKTSIKSDKLKCGQYSRTVSGLYWHFYH